MRFEELRKVLESCGYVMNAPRTGSSHYTFRKQGCQPITIPKHEPIKKAYVELVKHVQIGASYGWGITKIVNKIAKEGEPAGTGRNNCWTVTAAYLF